MKTITYGSGRNFGPNSSYTVFIDNGVERKEFLPESAAYNVVFEVMALQMFKGLQRKVYDMTPHEKFWSVLNNLFVMDTRLDEF